MSLTKVINVRDAPKGWMRDPRYVYIGRIRWDQSHEDAERGFDGRFGNPIVLRFEQHRAKVVAAYRNYFYRRLERDPLFKARIHDLWGMTLVCHCAPLACHGDVIAAWLDDPDAP